MARHNGNGNGSGLPVTTDPSIPIQIQRAIRRVEVHVSQLHATTQEQGQQIEGKVSFSKGDLYVMAGHMRDHLQATGSHPLSVTNLPGVTGQPQTPIGGSGVQLGGDLGGTDTSPLVVGIQGRPVAPTAPSDGYVLTWVNADGKWEPLPQTGGGGGGGTVLSVGLAAPVEFTVTGSPVTTTGTLTFAKVSQGANQVWAGPVSGSGVPVFRALVLGDMPSGIAPQVNSDWLAISGPSMILNKPVIPPAYTLPIATPTVLGGVKIGANISVAGDGTISVAAPTSGIGRTILINGVGVSDDPIITFNAPKFITFNGA